jgi:predicted nucleic acid-binding protein
LSSPVLLDTGVGALEHGLPVATNNTAHFSRIEGLDLQNWIGPA